MTDHSLTIGRSAFPAPERLDAEPAPPAERDAFWVELREAAASIGRRRLHIAVGILMCLWAAFLAIALLPSAYLGTAQVLLDPRALKVTDSEVVPPSGSAEMNDAIVETQKASWPASSRASGSTAIPIMQPGTACGRS